MKSILITLALAAIAALVQAQPEGGNPPGGGPPPGGPDGLRRPVPPLFAALDIDKDGKLSADEISKASASLLTLDKNGDGIINKEELRPAMPPRGEGKPPGEGAGRGEGKPPGERRSGPGGPPPVER